MGDVRHNFCLLCDWPLERVLIDIMSIPDRTKIEYSKVCEVHVTSVVTV